MKYLNLVVNGLIILCYLSAQKLLPMEPKVKELVEASWADNETQVKTLLPDTNPNLLAIREENEYTPPLWQLHLQVTII